MDKNEALKNAIDRMDRARSILTNDNPQPECNWGVLDTSDLKEALAQTQEPVAHCEAGPNYCWKCLEESNPTYGSEEIKKLREVNKSLMKNIEELKKEPPPFWPVVQHLLDEYGLQFIDIVAAYRESTQPEQEPVAWPCLIDSADFSENTITLVMQCEDYKVSAGTHYLSTTPPKE